MKTKLIERLIEQMQDYVAETCIGPSALRNQGGSGLIEASRKLFKTIPLGEIPTEQHHFDTWLDAKTQELMSEFPKGAQHYGAARKALNLFLRSVAYNAVLNKHYHLNRLLPLLEIPLDSYAAKALKVRNPELPGWHRLKSISEIDHRAYQEAASHIAAKENIHRAHLDIFFFRVVESA